MGKYKQINNSNSAYVSEITQFRRCRVSYLKSWMIQKKARVRVKLIPITNSMGY